MNNSKTLSYTLALAVLASCATGSLTTPEQRQTAQMALTVIETSLAALKAKGKISTDDYLLAITQLSTLREEVENSGVIPVNFADVLLKITNLGLAWIPSEN